MLHTKGTENDPSAAPRSETRLWRVEEAENVISAARQVGHHCTPSVVRGEVRGNKQLSVLLEWYGDNVLRKDVGTDDECLS
jgi:hypothetical protein